MKMKVDFLRALPFTLFALLTGCHHDPPPVASIAVEKAVLKVPEGVTLDDIAEGAGIRFKHVNGAFGKKWLPETMGSGLAWIDYDNDGLPDLYLVNSREWTDAEKKGAKTVQTEGLPKTVTGKLYHNLGNGKFEDVTEKAGLAVPMYGMGVCVGDYDNDGSPDLYVTALGHNYLFRNNGDGTFRDVTLQSGVRDGGWSTSCAWLDYDKDGKLDLVVAHYVKWAPAADIPFPRSSHLTYGTPQQYVGEPVTLYHNEGNGKFKEVASASGLRANAEGRALQGKSLGVVICDYNNDGYPDIALANDTEPNYLYENQKNGKFKEVGVEQGMAVPDNGVVRGAMGIDACDYDRTGKESLVIGNFSSQGMSLYHNEGATFRDVATQSGVFQPTVLSLTFGCFFFDLDNDGWRDLFVGNGHVDDDISEVSPKVKYAEQPHVFRNLGNGKFEDLADALGGAMSKNYVARGAAAADFLLNGSVGIAISTSNGPAHLFRNNGSKVNHSLRLELEGTKSNRSAIGSAVQVKFGGATQVYQVRSGGSYCSQNELPLTIGLGPLNAAESVTILWPSGEKTELTTVVSGQIYRVVEGKGITVQRKFGEPIKKP